MRAWRGPTSPLLLDAGARRRLLCSIANILIAFVANNATSDLEDVEFCHVCLLVLAHFLFNIVL